MDRGSSHAMMESMKLLRTLQLGLLLVGAVFSLRAEDLEYNRFTNLTGDAWLKANADETTKHLNAWRSAKGDDRKREADAVLFYAERAGLMDTTDEVIADGRLLESEVKLPTESHTVRLDVKLEVPHVHGKWGQSAVVWRRITSSSFELWTPSQGWLFNRNGEVVHTAKPPRTDGEGRQWIGAFLPDGHWLTTELHEGDGRAYIFNAKGRCTHEIKSGNLLNLPGYREKTLIIPWARSDRDGDAWVVRVGSEEGLGESLLEPDGTWRRIKGSRSIWQHCMTRQLGVRLMAGICYFEVESDDGKARMQSGQPSHGSGVGNPTYEINTPLGMESLGHIPSDGRDFGFWPSSHAVQVFNGHRTWFFDATRHFQGWIAGERVGDGADRKSMIFRLDDGRYVTVSPSLTASSVGSYELPDGQRLYPLELQSDIGLGLFATRPSEDDRAITSNRLLEAGAKVYVAQWNIPKKNARR